MIQPTVGRVLHCVVGQEHREYLDTSPGRTLAALITDVHGPSMVNLAVFTPQGVNRSLTSVRLVQDGETPPDKDLTHCRWMPYQVGQAAKTAELEKRFAETVPASTDPAPAAP